MPSDSAVLRVQYEQHCTLVSQSERMYMFLLASDSNMYSQCKKN